VKFQATIDYKCNLSLVARERGNIWVNFGGEWLAKRIAYSSFSPLTQEDSTAIRYMGLGIGGNRQIALGVANSAPLVTSYPGTNAQTDTNPALLALERPVRLTGGSTAYPGEGTDVWLGQVQAPAAHPTPKQTEFRRLFDGASELSYGPYLTVPVSEIGLFLHSTSPTYVNVYNNQPVAYDTFDTISINSGTSLEVIWTIRF